MESTHGSQQRYFLTAVYSTDTLMPRNASEIFENVVLGNKHELYYFVPLHKSKNLIKFNHIKICIVTYIIKNNELIRSLIQKNSFNISILASS